MYWVRYLYIAAHPDDENTRLLAYLANEKLYRTGYLSLTRGDGGQNLIGDEEGVDLSLIRTQEFIVRKTYRWVQNSFLAVPLILVLAKAPKKPYVFGVTIKY